MSLTVLIIVVKEYLDLDITGVVIARRVLKIVLMVVMVLDVKLNRAIVLTRMAVGELV